MNGWLSDEERKAAAITLFIILGLTLLISLSAFPISEKVGPVTYTPCQRGPPPINATSGCWELNLTVQASTTSGGPILTLSVTTTNAHPGDYLSLAIASLSSWNGTKSVYSGGPISIQAVTSAGVNYTPLSGIHKLLNGTAGIGWMLGNEPINFITVQATDLQTGLVQRIEIDIAPSWSQVIGMINRTIGDGDKVRGANDRLREANMWFLFYFFVAAMISLWAIAVLSAENRFAHAQTPPRLSGWDRVKTWIRVSRDPIPDVLDLAFTDREHVYGDIPLKMQLDILKHREEYLNWIQALLMEFRNEIRQLPDTRKALRERFIKNRRELGLDPDWEV
jgi:hypothetical protein